ncbi:hypothetical protein BXZ70DRAFT_117570 [Cristinia sonorae]|uniref:Uncharacterized protein n=1 Tax=Cristinia sonorae TaxID=1940300 RepID=A0A8K0XQL9_9AGAR|nr:hypothetical protein BXZ70DRAFT_117570 [Cristinia sonorae]
MSNSTYFGPSKVDETPSDIFLEKTFLVSGYLTGLGFGVQFVLYLACVRILLQRKIRTRFTYFLLAYITVLCSLNLIYTATSMIGLQLCYIDNRNYPGGPFGYLTGPFTTHPDSILSLAAYIISSVMADGLLLWRCRVIWYASLGKKVYFVVLIPFLMWLASFALGMIFEVVTSAPAGLYSSLGNTFAVPFFTMSLTLNILLTLLIVARMWFHQRQGRKLFGPNYGQHYTSISNMFIESAALYCINSILLLATFITGHPINQIWVGIAPSVQMVSSYLIIYRVAQGRAWDVNTTHQTKTHALTSLAFSTGPTYQPGSRGRLDKRGSDDEVASHTAVDIPLHDVKGIHVTTTVHSTQV